jgi:rhodanese-related sulfurtransferase
MSKTPTISPAQVIPLLTSHHNALLVDVRTPAEYAATHVTGALNIPLDLVPTRLHSGDPSLPKDALIFLLCEKGGRASKAAAHFLDAGFDNIHVVEGGTQAWIAGGHPVVSSGKSVISIERQVRIGAGSLVLLGVILSLLVNPDFIILSGFIGAGLVFAGITDWCGMGLLLARLPWNR